MMDSWGMERQLTGIHQFRLFRLGVVEVLFG